MSKMRAGSSTRLHQKYSPVFDGLNQGFGGVANTIKNLEAMLCRGYRWRTFVAGSFIDLASGLQTTAQMASLTGVSRSG